MTARAIARLLPPGAEVTGRVIFDGVDVLALSGAELRAHRSQVAVVFQDPRAHINPVRRIDDFMTESLRTLDDVPRPEASRRAAQALEEVGIDDPSKRLRQYPHELSGGMLQRVMIATALLSQPRLLLADECTTALDVTTQSEVMAILDELRRERGLSMLFITHDLELAGAVCDRTCVMYAGQVVETRTADQLHADPLHPYSAALVQARPDITSTARPAGGDPGSSRLRVRGADRVPVRPPVPARHGRLPQPRAGDDRASTTDACAASELPSCAAPCWSRGPCLTTPPRAPSSPRNRPCPSGGFARSSAPRSRSTT